MHLQLVCALSRQPQHPLSHAAPTMPFIHIGISDKSFCDHQQLTINNNISSAIFMGSIRRQRLGIMVSVNSGMRCPSSCSFCKKSNEAVLTGLSCMPTMAQAVNIQNISKQRLDVAFSVSRIQSQHSCAKTPVVHQTHLKTRLTLMPTMA